MDYSDFDWYILEVNPEPWAVGPIAYARRGGKMSAYMGQNAQLNAYKEALKEEIANKNPKMLEGKITLQLFFWRRRDDYETPQGKRARKHEADTTNLQKATEDAMQGILYKNDKDVVDVHSRMIEQDVATRGRVVIGVSNRFQVIEYPFDKIEFATKTQALKGPAKQLEGQEELWDIDSGPPLSAWSPAPHELF